MYVLALPSGKTYGCFFLKTWPTRLQGRISRLPPHCHTRNEISAHTNAHSRPVFSPRHRPAPSHSFSRWLPAPHQFPVVFNQTEDLSKQPHVSSGRHLLCWSVTVIPSGGNMSHQEACPLSLSCLSFYFRNILANLRAGRSGIFFHQALFKMSCQQSLSAVCYKNDNNNTFYS